MPFLNLEQEITALILKYETFLSSGKSSTCKTSILLTIIIRGLLANRGLMLLNRSTCKAKTKHLYLKYEDKLIDGVVVKQPSQPDTSYNQSFEMQVSI